MLLLFVGGGVGDRFEPGAYGAPPSTAARPPPDADWLAGQPAGFGRGQMGSTLMGPLQK